MNIESFEKPSQGADSGHRFGAPEVRGDSSWSSESVNGKWVAVRRDVDDGPYIFSLENADISVPQQDNRDIAYIGMNHEEAKKVYDFALDLLRRGNKSDQILAQTRSYITYTLHGGIAEK